MRGHSELPARPVTVAVVGALRKTFQAMDIGDGSDGRLAGALRDQWPRADAALHPFFAGCTQIGGAGTLLRNYDFDLARRPLRSAPTSLSGTISFGTGPAMPVGIEAHSAPEPV